MRYETAIPIGRGGMGDVLKAYDPDLGRQVAIKVLRHADPELEARLLREARAQAKISHPNVCRVYDVGRREGQAFIAMEYIDGRPLDEAAEGLSLEAKIRLVKIVAEAVHAAHRAGLVHRDLKPGNILVAEGETGELEPYVLDFGIAREHAAPGLTMSGQVLGTPGYLSPEQARGEVSTLDRRSDVYSLGVVLYELLAGRLPHTGESSIEIMVSLLEREPEPLARIAPGIPRDLETVVMKCLEKDPGRRYGSARELAQDLGRYLDGEPVAARPAGRLERLLRLARRHKIASTLLAAAGLAILALAVGLVLSWVKYTRDLERERDAALAAREVAEARSREAREVTDFMIDVFHAADPGATGGEKLTAREVLDAGRARIERDLAGQPLAQAALMTAIGRAYSELGLFDAANEILELAIALRREAGVTADLGMAESLETLADLRKDERAFPEAEELYRAAVDISKAQENPDPAHIALLESSLSVALLRQDKLDEAVLVSAESVAAMTEAGWSRRLLTVLANRAVILRAVGATEEAKEIYTLLFAKQRSLLGVDNPALSVTLNNLAYLLRTEGDHAGAERYYRESLEIVTSFYGDEHPHSLQVMRNLAGVLALEERFDEATSLLRHVIDVERRTSPGHWRLGSALVASLGRVLLEGGRYAEAEPVLREGLSVYETSLGADHSWAATTRGLLGACLFGLGRDSEAEELSAASFDDLRQRERLTPENRAQIESVVRYLTRAGRAVEAVPFRSLLQPDSQASAGN